MGAGMGFPGVGGVANSGMTAAGAAAPPALACLPGPARPEAGNALPARGGR
jgi:hypothetical protein